MTYRTASEYSNLFNTIVSVSGTIGGKFNKDSPLFKIQKPTNKVSLIHIHGVLDTNVRYEGGEGGAPGN
jgi:poly(3-hydroxybutyrate) depolymerase